MGHLELLLLLNFAFNRIQIILHIDLLDAVAVGANKVMVMPFFIELVALHPVGKLDRTENPFVGQELELAIHCAEIRFDRVLAQKCMNILCRQMLVVLQENTKDPPSIRRHPMPLLSQVFDDVLFSVHSQKYKEIISERPRKS